GSVGPSASTFLCVSPFLFLDAKALHAVVGLWGAEAEGIGQILDAVAVDGGCAAIEADAVLGVVFPASLDEERGPSGASIAAESDRWTHKGARRDLDVRCLNGAFLDRCVEEYLHRRVEVG